MSRGTHSFFWTPGAAAVGGSSVVEPRVTGDIGHYRHRRLSRRRVGASTGVIEDPNAVLVRSRVPRTGAAFGRRAEVPRVRSRADYDGGARRGVRLTRLLAGRERRRRPHRGRRADSPARDSLSSSRGLRTRVGEIDAPRMAAPLTRRLAAAGAWRARITEPRRDWPTGVSHGRES